MGARYRGRLWPAALLAMLAIQLVPASVHGAGFVVIVHPSNPSTELSREELSSLFLKATRRWPDGTTVTPVDQPVDSSVRQDFSMVVHLRRANSIENYWREMIFNGKEVPPLRRKSDEKVVDLIRRTRGGIGYVSAGAAVDGVKVVAIKD